MDQRPNLVVLMLDDHPAMDDRIFERLPNIKSLFIDQGMSFSNYWANFSFCCPGRASFLTGQEAHHHGVTSNLATLFDSSVTLATELQEAGYHTIISGKYLNGTSHLIDKTPFGWDDVAIKDEGPYFNYDAWVDGVIEHHGNLVADYSTDVMADHALRFMRETPADKPVFALLTPNATHAGADDTGERTAGQPVAAARHRGDPRCSGIRAWKPPNYNEADVSDKPDYIRQLPMLVDRKGWSLQSACESLLSVDEWLGRVVQELHAQGRYGNTVFVLTSDNGMAWGAHRLIGKVAPHAARMPLFISWPIEMGNAPSDNATLLSNVDIAPTLCELGNCTMGPFHNGFGLDGHSFAGLIADELYSSVPDRDAIILEGGGGENAVPIYRSIVTAADHRLGRWLFVHYVETGERELYDLSGGPCHLWQMGEAGDPCLMSNKAYETKFTSIKRNLRSQLDSMW